MHALDTSEPSPPEVRLRRERRVLAGVLGVLLLTSALLSPLAFGDLPLLLLYMAPFALALTLSVLIAPLGTSAETSDAMEQATAIQAVRRAAAAEHAIRTPARNELFPDSPQVFAAAVVAAATHGIHFGCAHLKDEDFLQAFHAGEVRPADFRHGDHLRYTVLMLQRVPAGLVEETIAKNLRTYLREVFGSEALFHATRTYAWITILQALPRAGFAHTLQQHAADLHGDAVDRFYSNELLASEEARRHAARPDREPLPRPYAPMRSRT